MGGVVSARKAQYFEPKYESKPSARVAPGRTGSDIFPDKKAASDAPVAPAAGSELYTILCKLTAKPGKGAEVYRYFQEKLMPKFQKEPDTLISVWKSTSVFRVHRQFFTKSFLGDDAAVLAPSGGEESAPSRYRAGAASMEWRSTRRFSTNVP